MTSATVSVNGAHSVATLTRHVHAVLADAGVSDPVREAREVIAAALDRPPLWPAVHGDDPVPERDAELAFDAARRRALGMPLAYAVGRAAFRHLTLEVGPDVLIPRPETEQLVDVVLEYATSPAADGGGIAVDIGTGSGAIALALATEGRFERVIATDVSTAALAMARRNVARVGAQMGACAPVEIRAGAGLAPVRHVRARAVVSNPPYIAYTEAPSLPADVRDWEPPIALFSADDGMAATAEIIRDAAEILEPGGLLAIEVDARRARRAADLAAADGRYAGITIRRDLAGRDRMLTAIRKVT
ncbi:MAG TPA: peptide chain release factor N(5)-glutamine methyltransferase [Gemmatimonadaceae bacterium]|nr:peptide chain release factor N(5)-glutamine methyltransferase [Gemmatimonadaceae bacterium]